MIAMTSDSDNRKASRTRKSSPSLEEEVPCGGENHLKKGPWTTAEDAILVQYITQHGEGNWNSVQKHSGLSRCGKSCRLRWANHLRPDLKKGAFTEEEEALVIELHAKMGNKWARMAAELPGRTDNEIKNFWNTRFKKLQRAGLPIYPPDICVQALNESEQTDDMITGSEDIHQADALDIPDVEFKNLELNQGFLNCSPTMLNIHNFHKSVGPSQSFGYMFPEMNPHKRLREIGTQLRGSFDQYDDDDAFVRLSSVQSLWSPPSLEVPGSHIPINGKSSSSDLNSEAMKIELPSLQYSTSQVGVWATPSSPLPSLESSVDTLIQSPLSPSNCPSPRSSGLLEAVVYESRSMKNSNQPLSEATFMAGDGVESSSGSGASFSEELQSAETGPGYMTAEVEPVDWASIESDGKKDISSPLEYLRPDALLDSFWFGHRISHSKEQIFTGDVGALLDEDLNCEYKPSESNQSFGPFSKND